VSEDVSEDSMQGISRREGQPPTELQQREAGGREISAAMTAWDETRALLMDADRDTISAQPNPRAVPRELQRLIDALRRADRTRPSWVYLAGNEPRDPMWTERQLQQTRAAARRLRSELERAQTAAREARRSPTDFVQRIAQSVEEGLTAVLRPLSLAVATTTGPMQRGFGSTAGIGLVAAAVVAALFLFRK